MIRTARNLRIALMASAGVTLMLGAAPAMAQTPVPTVPDAVQESPPAPDQSPAAQVDETATTPDEGVIIITAQKRAEDQQDVPISISVVSGEQMAETGATQLTEIAGYVPGLNVSSGGAPGQTVVSLRGIATLAAGATVGTYVDEAPTGSSTVYTESAGFTVDLLPYDLARIEVLRGPQGTLYGASSIGGLLKYVTIAPDLDEFRAKAGVELFAIDNAGKIGHAEQVFVNVPLIPDRLAMTASAANRKTPGYIDNIQTGRKDQNRFEQTGFRGSVLLQASENLRLRLSGLRQTIDSDNGSVLIEDLTGNPIGNGRSNFNYIPETFTSKFRNFAGTAEYDFGFAALSSTTTFTKAKRVETFDASRVFGVLFPLLTGGAIGPGIVPFRNPIELDKITEEVRLSSRAGGRFEWLAGFFYTDEDANNQQLVTSFDLDGNVIAPLNPLATIALPSTYKEYAFFGNATARFTEQLWLTGGLRYAHNDQTFKQISSGAIVPVANTPGKSNESVVTYSVSPQFHLNKNTMFYGRVATGYRPGGPNVTFPGVPPTFDADTVTNYELGFKARINRAVTVDIALFQMDQDDIQVTKSFPGGSGLANGGSARSKGIEAAVLWQPVRGLSLGANGAYTDSELTEDAPEIGGLKGERLPGIPKLSGSLTADYKFRLGNLGAEVGGGVRHTGKRFSDVGASFDGVAGASKLALSSYTAVDLFGSLMFNERYKVRAYVRNLTNTDGPLSRSLVSDGIGRPSYISVVPLQPRTVGLALDAEF